MTELALKHLSESPLDGDWEYALRIPHSPFGPGIVRAHVRAVLSRHRANPAVLDNAQLVASELVTNSLACTRDSVAVRLVRTDGRLRLSVWDSSPYPPPHWPGPAAAPEPDAESGRGLMLARACADDWGHYLLVNGRRNGGGKEVWAEWRTPGA
ncbi:anti-sigma regulatory factor (Ser/Thr protein kinase) [Streptomyces sp. V3I8]|uniref:ATP-binding protein n=1 Tax=Streptomyces sp. V3I8 TaxID=3042279 RepID=UPI002787A82B|nr:ATP-binding protein [Streptomyces sp. V3I8]MDQ1036585.1 anti-sigma regulatory factor (Ser/Thr protein kinase) [Streptomyces sp. V3I8]